LEYQNTVAIRKRNEKDIWQGLFEFPLVEAKGEITLPVLLKQAEKNRLLIKGQYETVAVSPLYKQQLSHRLISGQFITLKLKRKPVAKDRLQWVEKKALAGYAFPQFVNQYLKRPARVNVLL
jgi:A/G-specific adenine glycosylase